MKVIPNCAIDSLHILRFAPHFRSSSTPSIHTPELSKIFGGQPLTSDVDRPVTGHSVREMLAIATDD